MDYAAFFKYVEDGNGEGIHRMCSQGAYVNTRNWRDETPLHKASSLGNLSIVKLLLEYGADVNARENYFKSTPLTKACKFGHLPVVLMLVDHGADVNIQGYGCSPLCTSCANGHENIVNFLLLQNPLLEIRTKALIPAIKGCTPQMVERLMRHAPKITAPVEAVVAACRESLDMLKALLRCGAEVNGIFNNHFSISPLHLAVAEKHSKEMATLLLDAGADVNVQRNDGSTPLHVVVGIDRGIEMATLLLNAGANIEAQRHDGSTPLHVVADMGRKEMATLLLDEGANLEARRSDGSTPLVCAFRYKKLDTIDLLLARGADVNVKGSNDVYYPLHLAVSGQEIDLTKKLLDIGANPNVTDIDGKTPLLWACESDIQDIVRSLLDKGANPNGPDIQESITQYPLYIAVLYASSGIVHMLLERGARIESIEDLMAMLDAAWDRKDQSTMRLLLQRGRPLTVTERQLVRVWAQEKGWQDLFSLDEGAG